MCELEANAATIRIKRIKNIYDDDLSVSTLSRGSVILNTGFINTRLIAVLNATLANEGHRESSPSPARVTDDAPMPGHVFHQTFAGTTNKEVDQRQKAECLYLRYRYIPVG